MKPIQIHVVGTVIQRLIEDCTAAARENKRHGHTTRQEGSDCGRAVGSPRLRRTVGANSPSGGSLLEWPDVAVRRKPAGSVSAEPGIMLIP